MSHFPCPYSLRHPVWADEAIVTNPAYYIVGGGAR